MQISREPGAEAGQHHAASFCSSSRPKYREAEERKSRQVIRPLPLGAFKSPCSKALQKCSPCELLRALRYRMPGKKHREPQCPGLFSGLRSPLYCLPRHALRGFRES
ncbi:hypothetical protein NDU88_008147 [Pleurodeles waltl]|uniref:Uncharacterized protein n=1 Tax=Pleurodeles waltl TaxID=8319 RepID=A0AAV7VWG2_PLEWA|nr:hypothetical protein NDU88_008147 [Pleurodeles waltl]